MCVMTSISIYIEWTKGVQRIMGCKVQPVVNILVSKNWDEVHTVHYCIKVDNSRAVCVTIHIPFLLSLTLVYTILTTAPPLTHFSHICVHYSHDHSTSDSFLSHSCTLFSWSLHLWLTSLTITPLWLIVLTYHPYLRIVYIEPDIHCKYPT